MNRDIQIPKTSATKGQSCVVFTHALHRDGANHVLLYTLERLIRQGCPVPIVFSPIEGPMRADFESIGIKVDVVDLKGLGFQARFKSTLDSFKADYIVCNTMFRADCVCMAAASGVPSLWVIHEAWTEKRINELANDAKSLDIAQVRHAFTRCDRIVLVSQMQEAFYRKMFVIPEGRTQVIYNGIPLDKIDTYRLSANREVARAELGYKPEDFLVLHIGTVSVRKGQIATAKAIAKLRKKVMTNPNIKVLFVGDLKLNDMEKVTPAMYIEMIRDHLKENNVSFAMFEETPVRQRGEATVTMMDVQSHVNRLYLAADCVVLPSLNEVLPMVLCEGMAFEKPLISTSIDAIPEAITHGENGFLVKPGVEGIDDLANYIEQLATDSELCLKLGQCGRARVEKQFSLEVMGRTYMHAVKDILKEEANVNIAASKTAAVKPMRPHSSAGTSTIAPKNTAMRLAEATHHALLDSASSTQAVQATARGMHMSSPSLTKAM